MKIAIVDDERPSRSELRYLVQELEPDAEIAELDSGAAAVELAAEQAFDLFFLDINLGDMSGTALAVMLRHMLPQASIVFATAYSEYATKAFDLEAVDYIMKPFEKSRVKAALGKASAKIAAQAAADRPVEFVVDKLPIPYDKKMILLDIGDIVYIEKDDRFCNVHCKKEVYATSLSLGYFENRLNHKGFFRIHKSFIVNLNCIAEISPWFNNLYSAKLSALEGVSLPISRKQIKLLRSALNF